MAFVGVGEANQSEITKPSKPHSPRSTSASSQRAVGAVLAVEPVVGGHDPEGAALLDRELEREQVDLAQRALVDHRVGEHAVVLGLVAGEVLHRAGHALGLGAPHERGAEAARRAAGPRSSTRSCGRRAATGGGSPSGRAAPGTPWSGPRRRAPRRPARAASMSQVAPSAAPDGTHSEVIGRVRAEPGGRAGPRAPFGPSVTRTDGMPRRSTATVDHMSAPASSAAFSSRSICATRAGRSRAIGRRPLVVVAAPSARSAGQGRMPSRSSRSRSSSSIERGADEAHRAAHVVAPPAEERVDAPLAAGAEGVEVGRGRPCRRWRRRRRP